MNEAIEAQVSYGLHGEDQRFARLFHRVISEYAQSLPESDAAYIKGTEGNNATYFDFGKTVLNAASYVSAEASIDDSAREIERRIDTLVGQPGFANGTICQVALRPAKRS